MNDPIIVTIIVSLLSGGAVSAVIYFAVISVAIGKYQEKVDQLEKCNLNQRLATLEGKYETSITMQTVLQRKSPVSLTNIGENLLNNSTGKEFIDKRVGDLIEKINIQKPKTAYDVQEISKVVVSEMSNDDSFNPIKNYAFKEGLDLSIILAVMGIYLRDIAIEKLGFKVADVDKHDPNKNHSKK